MDKAEILSAFSVHSSMSIGVIFVHLMLEISRLYDVASFISRKHILLEHYESVALTTFLFFDGKVKQGKF